MLSVIIDARTEAQALPALLAQLTAGAVDGLVRQVMIVADPEDLWIADLCEESGADAHASLPEAAAAARADWLLVLPSGLRLRDGWIGSLSAHLLRQAGPAMVLGLAPGRWLRPGPFGLLVERGGRLDGQSADLHGLRRQLGRRLDRIG